MRPSHLLEGDLTALAVDMAFGLTGVLDGERELGALLKKKSIEAGVAGAAYLAQKAVP